MVPALIASKGEGMVRIEHGPRSPIRESARNFIAPIWSGVFSVLFYLSVMGIALNLILRSIAKRYAFWSHRSDAGEHSA